jgi:transcriptional regulator GlxA family with amidase domain
MADVRPLEAFIVALPESAGSAIYGLVDVFASTGTLWRELIGETPGRRLIRPRIVSVSLEPFICGNRIPIRPDLDIDAKGDVDVIVVPELWLAPNDSLTGRYEELKEWLRRRHRAGSTIYSACSGSVLLAASGLLDGKEATSHWGYADLFRRSFPRVRFLPEPNMVFADPTGHIVTAGGATSWHDLAIHIISRHCSPGDALQIAKVYLLQWHGEGQLPYASLVRRQAHADAGVRQAENWLADHFSQPRAVAAVVARSGIAERSLKRRFKAATGSTIIEYAQSLRIEAAKQQLESSERSSDEIASAVGYENPVFFRRLFKRLTGLTPGEYRRLFRPIAAAADPNQIGAGR